MQKYKGKRNGNKITPKKLVQEKKGDVKGKEDTCWTMTNRYLHMEMISKRFKDNNK